MVWQTLPLVHIRFGALHVCPSQSTAQQSLAEDGATAYFSNNLFPAACLLIARRS
jgi:hypothetical protein